MTNPKSKSAVRKRERRKEARPGELIAAGLAEFAEFGFARARLEDVARRAGVSKGTIYRYFPDKEALFLAAAQSVATKVQDEIISAITAFEGTTEELIRLLLEQLYRLIETSEIRTIIRIVFTEGPHYPALVTFYYQEVVSRGRTSLRHLVDRGLARGEIARGPSADFPEVIMAPALMSVIWRQTFGEIAPIPGSTFHAAHLDLLLKGFVLPASDAVDAGRGARRNRPAKRGKP